MIPGGVDAGSIIDMFNSGYDRSKARADERKAVDAFGGYLDSVYSGQGAPQSLSALGGMMSAPVAGQVQRSPLPAPTDPATARVEQAFAAQGQGSAPTDLNSNAIAARFLKTIRDGGITNPYALAAIAATGKRESGFDPKNAVRTWSDPSQSGQAGTAGGIMSWRNERLQALQQFAQQNGDDPRAPSPETQAKFLLAEDPTLIQKLQSAGSAEEAQQMMNNAWRYAGYDQPGGETAQRMALAGQYAQQFGASPSQQALEGLAVGQSMPMGQGVQVADASGVQGFQAPAPSSILPPREVMAALFRSPATRPFAIQLAQSAQGLRQNANDPMAQVQYQTAVANLQKLQREATTKGNEVFGTPIYGKDAEGNTVLGAIGKDGTFQRLDTGGVDVTPGVTWQDFGTYRQAFDKSGAPVGGPVAKENYQEAFDKGSGLAGGKAQAEAEASLPTDLATADQALVELNELIDHPGLASIAGPLDQYRPSWSMGPEGRDALARYNQAKGRAFLQAFGMLKGGGQITEIEGLKAEQAMARMDRAQSEPEFKKALEDFRDAVKAGREKLMQRAGRQSAGQVNSSGSDYKSRYGLE